MERFRFYAPIGAVVVIGVLLQLLFVRADNQDTPGKAAVRFVKACYQLDPSTMRGLLCKKTAETAKGDVVARYIRQISLEAGQRGFGMDFMKQALYDIKTHTERIDDNTAKVRLRARSRTAINPVYALVARIFHLGETREVDQVLTVVKENGCWKVCDNPLSRVQTDPDASSKAG